MLYLGKYKLPGQASREGLSRGVETNALEIGGVELRLTPRVRFFLNNPTEENVQYLSPSEAAAIDNFAIKAQLKDYLDPPIGSATQDMLFALQARRDRTGDVDPPPLPAFGAAAAAAAPTGLPTGLLMKPTNVAGTGNPRNFPIPLPKTEAIMDDKTGMIYRRPVAPSDVAPRQPQPPPVSASSEVNQMVAPHELFSLWDFLQAQAVMKKYGWNWLRSEYVNNSNKKQSFMTPMEESAFWRGKIKYALKAFTDNELEDLYYIAKVRRSIWRHVSGCRSSPEDG